MSSLEHRKRQQKTQLAVAKKRKMKKLRLQKRRAAGKASKGKKKTVADDPRKPVIAPSAIQDALAVESPILPIRDAVTVESTPPPPVEVYEDDLEDNEAWSTTDHEPPDPLDDLFTAAPVVIRLFPENFLSTGVSSSETRKPPVDDAKKPEEDPLLDLL